MMSTAEIAGRAGLKRQGRSWRGTCPACGYPTAFSMTGGKRHSLAYCANGCTQETLAKTLDRITGGDWKMPDVSMEKPDDAARRQRATDAALRIWAGSTTALHSIADIYLTSRALPCLRLRWGGCWMLCFEAGRQGR